MTLTIVVGLKAEQIPDDVTIFDDVTPYVIWFLGCYRYHQQQLLQLIICSIRDGCCRSHSDGPVVITSFQHGSVSTIPVRFSHAC